VDLTLHFKRAKTKSWQPLRIFLFCVVYLGFYASVKADENESVKENSQSSFLSGFSFRPGLGTSFVDVWITRKKDGYEAMLTHSKQSPGTPYVTFSITSPEYYFYEKSITTNNGSLVQSRWGLGARTESYTFGLTHQTLAQEDFNPVDIGTSVTGIMSYAAILLVARFDFDANSTLGIGWGYARGKVSLDGTAVFGPERNTTGLSQKQNIGFNSNDVAGVVFVIEGEHSHKLVWGFEVGILHFGNEENDYLASGAKFYLSYPFRL